MARKRLELREFTVSQLLNHLESRRFAVPAVQREFVWDGRKACKFLDSIYRQMPVGAVMIWETNRKNRHHLREHINVLPEFDGSNRDIWFLLDGQQRISVLYQARRGARVEVRRGKEINFANICFLLEPADNGVLFAYRRAVPGKYASLSDILAANWRRRFQSLPAYKMRKLVKCRELLLKYRLPLLFIRTNDHKEVREAFIRINSLGTPVSAADKAFARASEFGMRHLARQAQAALHDSFKDLPDNALLLAMAFMRGERLDVGERVIDAAIRKLEREVERDKAALKSFTKEWTRLRAAVEKAVDYMRANFSVINRGFLPSDNMLVVLSLFFYWNKARPNPRQKREIRKWFWASAVCKRYSGRGHRVNILRDLKFFERLARKKVARFQLESRVRRQDIKETEYTTHGSLSNAFFCLLLRQQPRSLEDGDRIPIESISARANKNQKHHVFPRGKLKRAGFSVKDCNSLCNICLLTAEENQMIGNRLPARYLKEVPQNGRLPTIMKSHLITTRGSGLWERDAKTGYRRFVRSRLNEICAAFEREAGIKLFHR